MIKVSGLGTDLGQYWLNWDLLGLKSNKNKQKIVIFAISDDFQHLVSIEQIQIPKRY